MFPITHGFSAQEIERLQAALAYLEAVAETGVMHQTSLSHAGLVELLEEVRDAARAALDKSD